MKDWNGIHQKLGLVFFRPFETKEPKRALGSEKLNSAAGILDFFYLEMPFFCVGSGAKMGTFEKLDPLFSRY